MDLCAFSDDYKYFYLRGPSFGESELRQNINHEEKLTLQATLKRVIEKHTPGDGRGTEYLLDLNQ